MILSLILFAVVASAQTTHHLQRPTVLESFGSFDVDNIGSQCELDECLDIISSSLTEVLSSDEYSVLQVKSAAAALDDDQHSVDFIIYSTYDGDMTELEQNSLILGSVASALEYGRINSILKTKDDYLYVCKGSFEANEDFVETTLDDADLDYGDYNKSIEVSIKTKFLLLGDWGKGGLTGDITQLSTAGATPQRHSSSNNKQPNSYTYQAAIGRAMNQYIDSSAVSVEGIFTVGDNFYTAGVKSTNDTQWTTSWSQVYSGSSLSIPWYAALGNHDYGYGAVGVSAQIDKTAENGMWNMPATNYTKRFTLQDNTVLQVIWIDTTTLAPSENVCCNLKGGVSVSEQESRIADQLEHIEDYLIEATSSVNYSTWTIVIGHYPIYSSGSHGDIGELISKLQPLLEKYEVHAYFSGHDHISEHLSKSDIEYFVCGAGSMTDKLGRVSSQATLQWSSVGVPAFGALTVSATQLVVDYIDMQGSIIYTAVLDNPRQHELTEVDDDVDPNRHSSASYRHQAMAVALRGYYIAGILLVTGLVLGVFLSANNTRRTTTTKNNEKYDNVQNNVTVHDVHGVELDKFDTETGQLLV